MPVLTARDAQVSCYFIHRNRGLEGQWLGAAGKGQRWSLSWPIHPYTVPEQVTLQENFPP